MENTWNNIGVNHRDHVPSFAVRKMDLSLKRKLQCIS